MAGVRDMIEKADTRELSPASQPADLSQVGMMPEGYWREQAEARDAPASDPSTQGGDAATTDQATARDDETEASSTSMTSAESDQSSSTAMNVQAGYEVEATGPRGETTTYDGEVGLDADNDTTVGQGAEYATAQGSGTPPEMLETALSPDVGNDGGGNMLDGTADVVPGGVDGVLDRAEDALDDVSSLTDDIGGIAAQPAAALESVDDLVSDITDLDASSLIGDAGGLGVLGSLFSSDDEGALDASLGSIDSEDGLSGLDLADSGLLDGDLLDSGLLDGGSQPSPGAPSDLLGGDVLDHDLGGLL